MIGIAGFYTFFWVLLSAASIVLKTHAASAAHWLLSLFGVPAQLVFLQEPTIIVGNVYAQINSLCAGDIEIALLLAIILASWDRTWRQRFIGCIFGILTVLIVNPIRIAVVLGAGHAYGWELADFAHDILFRASLFLIIVGFYFIWYTQYDRFAQIKARFLKFKR